jgi:hypothetical protein
MESLRDNNQFTGVVTTLAMPRFDHEQVADYLHMCLYRAGLVGDSPFDHTLVSKVTERAGGLVGAIDPIARELLQEAHDGRRAEADNGASPGASRRWQLAIVAAAGLGALLTIAVPDVFTRDDVVPSRSHTRSFHSNITPVPAESARRAQ